MAQVQADQSATPQPADARRLIAIVYADMVGYSRLIGLDDSGTFARLRELRRDLIDPGLARHGGALVNTAGDSLLMIFPSIIGAMRFAVEMQRAMPEFDGDYPADRRVRFRMGVNVGDAIADGTNLHGEGVNVAARLQTICPPGAICVSRIVRDHVGNRLGLPFKELGAVDLKNIAGATEAFVLDLMPTAAPPPPPRLRRARLLAGLAVAAVGVLAVRLGPGAPPPPPPPPQEAAQVVPGGPPPLSIAVLPFANLSGDPEQAYLADGIAEDLTTDLSHLDNAFVIARESAFSYRGKQVDIRDVGRQLGVRYVLEGSVRRINASVRINAQLIAAETGAHVWAERFDKPVADLGAGQDDIVARIGSALDVRLVNLEDVRRARAQSGSPAAFDLVLRARSVMQEPLSEDRDYIAAGLFMQALRADPSSVPAMTGLAAMLAARWNGVEPVSRATQLIAAAEQRAPGAPDVLAAKFVLLNRERRSMEALTLYRHLLDVAPNATGTILQIGGLCRCWTSSAEAIPLLQRTILLNPRSTALGVVRSELARTLLLADRAPEARELLERMLAGPEPAPAADGRPEARDLWRIDARIWLAIAYVRSDHTADARNVINRAIGAPRMLDYTVRNFLRSIRQYDDAAEVAQEKRFADDLRLAGLRDHLDEDADSGIASTGEMQEWGRLYTPTPMAVPGGRMVRTGEVIHMFVKGEPLVLTSFNWSPTILGSIFIDIPPTGTLQDSWQPKLQRAMRELAGGNLARPILVFGQSLNHWEARNLALRLIALGYTDVAWYRGGWEAWEASGMPRGPIASRRNL